MNFLQRIRAYGLTRLSKRGSMMFSFYPLICGILLAAFGIVRQQQINKTFLEIVFESERTGITQVFWDLGKGLNQQDSIAASIRAENSRKRVRFPLPETHIYKIRFDPNNQKGEFRLNELRIVDGAGNELIQGRTIDCLNPISGIGPISEYEDGLSFSIINNDPILLLNFDTESLNDIVAYSVWKRSWTGSLPVVILAFAAAFAGYFLIGGWLAPVTLAFITWQIFAPGIFSPDSLDQYSQAIHHTYWNWHPPVMAILLHHLLGTGLTLSQVIFLQILCGFLGVYFLIQKLFHVFAQVFAVKLKEGVSRYGGLIGLIILISPLTSFAPFISTFWKDVWFGIVLIWITGISLHLFYRKSEKRNRIEDVFIALFLIVLMVFSISVRYNAILLVPAYAVILFLAAKRLWIPLRYLGIGLIIAGSLFFNSALISTYKVKRLEPKLSVMGLEMVGLVVLYPELLDEYPYTKSQLKEDYRERFVWAAYRHLKWNDDSIVKPDFVKNSNNPALKEEYFRSVKDHPIKMTEVKIRNFVMLLDPRTTTEWCPRGIPENEQGLEPNFLYTEIRNRYYKTAYTVLIHPVLRWVSSVHLVWLILSLFLFGFSVSKFLSERSFDGLFMLSVSTMAPIYFFSYLLASPWKAFRYMYPATLLTQTVCFVLLCVWIHSMIGGIRRKSDASMNHNKCPHL